MMWSKIYVNINIPLLDMLPVGSTIKSAGLYYYIKC